MKQMYFQPLTETQTAIHELFAYNRANLANGGTKLSVPGDFVAAVFAHNTRNGDMLNMLLDILDSNQLVEAEQAVGRALRDDDNSVVYHSAAMTVGDIFIRAIQAKIEMKLRHEVQLLAKKAAL
jgi:hypothetical protein